MTRLSHQENDALHVYIVYSITFAGTQIRKLITEREWPTQQNSAFNLNFCLYTYSNLWILFYMLQKCKNQIATCSFDINNAICMFFSG